MSQPKRNSNKGRKLTDPVFEAGIQEGRQQMQVAVLTYLQQRYMDREVVRGSSLGKAILEVAADLSAYIKGLNNALANPGSVVDTTSTKGQSFVKPPETVTDGQ